MSSVVFDFNLFMHARAAKGSKIINYLIEYHDNYMIHN